MPLFQKKSKQAESEAGAEKPSLSIALGIQRANKKRAGGSAPIAAADLMDDDERAASIADAIINKRKAKKMAEGGFVESPMEGNPEDSYDARNEAAAQEDGEDSDPILKENYDGDQHGHPLEDDHDQSLVGKIRAKMKARAGC
jgi:hypothetical protein